VIQQHTISTIYPVGPVHCYSGELGGELVLFDTGPPTLEAQDYLRTQLDLSRLRHVVITHCHADHYGLAAWLEQETEAIVYLPYRDILKFVRHEERFQRLSELLLEIGFDQRFIEGFLVSVNDGDVMPPPPDSFRTVERDLPQHLDIEVVACPGHSQSDLVLVGSDWLVTGDVLLRGIFQAPLLDIDLETGKRFCNYEAYCATIIKLAALHGRQVLPGHRNTTDSIDATILFYVGKLLDRAALLNDFSGKDNVANIVNQLFGSGQREPFHYYLKASELVFIRDFLRNPDLLRTSLEQIGLFESVSGKFLYTIKSSTHAIPRN
jgi:2,4-dienoyl-CoA reductase (NADPH2)